MILIQTKTPSKQVTGKDNDPTVEVIDRSVEEKREGEGKSDNKENEGRENGEDSDDNEGDDIDEEDSDKDDSSEEEQVETESDVRQQENEAYNVELRVIVEDVDSDDSLVPVLDDDDEAERKLLD